MTNDTTKRPMWLSIGEAADLVGVHYNTAHKLVADGTWPSQLFLSRRKVPAAFLHELVDSCRDHPAWRALQEQVA
jgi:excisionase family DNA binding protein